MKKSVIIDIFRIFPVTIAQFSALFHYQFDECLNLFERTSVCVPVETEKIEPFLELFPWESVGCPNESRQITIDLIDRFHGIFIIRDSFCLLCQMCLPYKVKPWSQKRMCHLIIVNHSCPLLQMSLHCLNQLRGGRLPGNDNIEHFLWPSIAVVTHIRFRGIFYVLSVLAIICIGRFLLDEGLVNPKFVTEHDFVLIVFQNLKALFYPISACWTNISVVERKYSESLTLKKMG